jgi:hypothetical protein
LADLETIADGDELYRRLAPDHINPDGSVNSAAFKLRGKPDPGISVDLAHLTMPRESLAAANRSGFRLGSLVAALPRSIGLIVRHDPLPENRAHSLIEGENTKARCRKLAEGTTLLDLDT